MRKKAPIIILIAVQLVFALSLTAVKPVKEWMIHNLGETFTFEASYMHAYYDEANGELDLYAEIVTEHDTEHAVIGRYGIISTDETGISRISGFSQKKPRNQPYIKSSFEPFSISSCSFHSEISPEAYEALDFEFESQAGMFGFDDKIAKSSHDITIEATVYKGEIRYLGFFVDETPIEAFIKEASLK